MDHYVKIPNAGPRTCCESPAHRAQNTKYSWLFLCDDTFYKYLSMGSWVLITGHNCMFQAIAELAKPDGPEVGSAFALSPFCTAGWPCGQGAKKFCWTSAEKLILSSSQRLSPPVWGNYDLNKFIHKHHIWIFTYFYLTHCFVHNLQVFAVYFCHISHLNNSIPPRCQGLACWVMESERCSASLRSHLALYELEDSKSLGQFDHDLPVLPHCKWIREIIPFYGLNSA